MRPGVNGTCTSKPASFAAFSTAAQPPSTIRSASEICVRPPGSASLNAFWIPSSVLNTIASSAGLFTAQSFWGASRRRAPLAPPRLSVPRNDAADAHAVETSVAMGRPEARIRAFSAAMSAAPIRSWVTGGTGSCHSCGSAGTSGPR